MRCLSVRLLVPFCIACVVALFPVHAAGAQVLSSDTEVGKSTSTPSVTLHFDDDIEDDLKSVTTARLWATGATAVGIGLGVVTNEALVGAPGVIFGPAAGSFYARDAMRAWRGVGIRTGVLFGGGALAALIDPEPNSALDAGLAVTILLGITVSSIADIVGTSATSVREHNEEVRADRTASVSIGPWADPLERRPGVQLTLRF